MLFLHYRLDLIIGVLRLLYVNPHFFLSLLNSMVCYCNLLCSKSLTVCSWYVNGIFRNIINGIRTCKLDNPLFCNKLTSDIVILTETHACTNDVLNLNGDFIISNCTSEIPSRHNCSMFPLAFVAG